MKRLISLLLCCALAVLALSGRVGWQYGQTEVIESENPRRETPGVIIQAFWEVVIPGAHADSTGQDDASLFLPIQQIASFGVQEYVVNELMLVRELTIVTYSRTLYRIYSVGLPDPLDLVGQNELLEDRSLDEIDDKRMGHTYVRKTYPATTHQQILEYRVKERAMVDFLYTDLKATYLNYTLRDMVPEQRLLTVRNVLAKFKNKDSSL